MEIHSRLLNHHLICYRGPRSLFVYILLLPHARTLLPYCWFFPSAHHIKQVGKRNVYNRRLWKKKKSHDRREENLRENRFSKSRHEKGGQDTRTFNLFQLWFRKVIFCVARALNMLAYQQMFVARVELWRFTWMKWSRWGFCFWIRFIETIKIYLC